MPNEKPLRADTLTPEQLAAIRKLFAMGNLSPIMHCTQKKMGDAWRASESEEFLALCSRQLGKSFWALKEAIECAIRNPGSRILYYAPTKDKLRDIVNDNIEPIAAWAPEHLIRRHKAADRWFIGGRLCEKTGKWKGASELRLCVLERAHVNRNRGINAKGLIVIEEGGFVSSDDFLYAWESVIDPQRLMHKPKVLIVTTPSEDENHYIHTTLLPKLDAMGAVARYTIYDNPFLPDSDIEAIKGRVTKETWEREYLALITKSLELTVCPEFSDDIIEDVPANPHGNWLTFLDPGGAMDPHGIVVGYWDMGRKQFVVHSSLMVPINTELEALVGQILALEQGILDSDGKPISIKRHGADVPEGGLISGQLSKYGLPSFAPAKGPGSFHSMIDNLRVAIKRKEVVVCPRNIQLIAQLKYGRYNKQKTDFERTNGHHLDLVAALMYAFHHKDTTTDLRPQPNHMQWFVPDHMASHKRNLQRLFK